jgi:hypothetical protein
MIQELTPSGTILGDDDSRINTLGDDDSIEFGDDDSKKHRDQRSEREEIFFYILAGDKLL